MEIESTAQEIKFICAVNYNNHETLILDGDDLIRREMVDVGSNFLDDLSIPYEIDMHPGIYEWSGTVEWVDYGDGCPEPYYEGKFRLLYSWVNNQTREEV